MQVENSSLFLPWYNKNLIEYLQEYLKPDMNIFEYGCGFSSLFYAQNGCNVYSIETQLKWQETVMELAKKHLLDKKIHITLCTEISNFYQSILKHNIAFDIIIIDSIQRMQCLEVAKSSWKQGLIILDNTERPNLKNAQNIMQEFNFLEFEGIRPNDGKTSKALVFSK